MGRMTKHKKRYLKTGRKLFDGKPLNEVLAKLEQAFSLGCTDREACLYADISIDGLMRYQRRNPAFRLRKEELKDKPVLKARAVIVKALQADSVDTAKWYLERKCKNEFGQRHEISGPNGEAIPASFTITPVIPARSLPGLPPASAE